MSQKLLDEEQLVLSAGNALEAGKKNVTYFISCEVLESFNKLVPVKKRGAMIEVLMKQFIQRHAAIPMSREPKRIVSEEGD